MRKLKKIPVFLMALVLCTCSLITAPAFAANYGTAVFGDTQSAQAASQGDNDNDGSFEDIFDVEDPNVSTGDVNDWVERKGGDLISIITKGVRIFSVIGFFVCLLLIVVGAVGNKRTMVGGIIGLIIACLCFTAATMGPQIMLAIQSWLVS